MRFDMFFYIWTIDGECLEKKSTGGDAEWFDGEAAASGDDYQPTEQYAAGFSGDFALICHHCFSQDQCMVIEDQRRRLDEIEDRI